MSNISEGGSTPWYRQFWPWFLIALPGSVVIAGIAMIFVAFKHADTLVDDNYYRKGMAINQVIEQDQKAHELGLSAEVTFDGETGEILVTIKSGEIAEQSLELLLLHPIDAKRDQTLPLQKVAKKYHRADLEARLNHRYYLRLQPTTDPLWRLNGEIDFSHTNQVTLQAQ